MQMRVIVAGIIVILVVIAGVYFLVMPRATAASAPTTSIGSIHVKEGQFVVDGSDLSRVEIWATVPHSDESPSNDWVLVGTTTLRNEGSAGTQMWTLPIPKEHFAVTEVMARGYDTGNNVVEDVYLPQTGTARLEAILWATTTAETALAK